MFSQREREARHQAILGMMRKEDLKALILIGDTNVGPSICGDLRYYNDFFVIFYRQITLIFLEYDPVLFAFSETSRQAAIKRSSVKDCRYTEDLIGETAKLLKQRGILKGRIGLSLEMIPYAWFNFLKQELPEIEWVEIHPHLMKLRFKRSSEEMDVFRQGAKLGDGGFDSAIKIIRPGITEYEVVAAIEHYARANGAESHFTLIGSGRFSLKDNRLPLPYAPSFRRIEKGDSIVMEITPRFEGYWTQLVRTVNVGEPNGEIEQLKRVCEGAIKEGLKFLKPKNTVKDVVLAMDSYVSKCGFVLKPPIGHLCGIDLVEARISRQNEMVLEPGIAMIIHPTVFTPDGEISFFWGETYLVTQEGYERLNQSTDELLTI